jgi:adenosine kinase
MGNPLLDISAEVSQEILDKYDVQLNNAILAEEKHLPLYQELVDSFEVKYIAGGATQNSIRVAQWILGDSGSSSYMGAIGNDAFGETLEQCASQDGVRTHYLKNESMPTGTCAVLIHENERSLVANLAAANTFTTDHLETPEAVELVGQAQVVYSAGFFLTVSVESMLQVAKQCVNENKIFCINLSAPFIIEFFADQLAAVMLYADFVFCNESEAQKYAEVKGWDQGDLKKVALDIAALPKASGTRPRTVVFTQGSEPTLVASNGQVQEFEVELLPKELLVDTNGAGDSFVGGFIAQLARGKELAECVNCGHFCARTIIQRSGCDLPETCDYTEA